MLNYRKRAFIFTGTSAHVPFNWELVFEEIKHAVQDHLKYVTHIHKWLVVVSVHI